MPLCMTLNCALTISNYISSMFEVGQAGMTSTFRSQLIYMCQTWNQYSHPRKY